MLIDKIQQLLDTLQVAKEELAEWMEAIELDANYSEEAVKDTKSFINDIESLLHEIGA